MSEATFTLRHRAMWFLCWIAYRIVMAMPGPDDLSSRYGRLYLWLISYAGAYAHSDRSNFYLCNFFYRSDAEQKAAWDRHLALPSNVLGSLQPQGDK